MDVSALSKKVLTKQGAIVVIGIAAVCFAVFYLWKKGLIKLSQDEATAGIAVEQAKLQAETQNRVANDTTFVSTMAETGFEVKDTSTMTAKEKLQYDIEYEAALAEQKQIVALQAEYYKLMGVTAPTGGSLEAYKTLVETAKKRVALLGSYTELTGDKDFSDNNFISNADIERAITVAKQQKAVADAAAATAAAKEADKKAQRDWLINFYPQYQKNIAYITGILADAKSSENQGRHHAYNKTPFQQLESWGKGEDLVAAKHANYSALKFYSNGVSGFGYQSGDWDRSNVSLVRSVSALYANIAPAPASPRWRNETKEIYQSWLRSIDFEGKGYDWNGE